MSNSTAFEWTVPFVREITKKKASENQPQPYPPARAGKTRRMRHPKASHGFIGRQPACDDVFGGVRIGTARSAALRVLSSLVMMLRTTDCGGAAILRRATPRRRIKMKMKAMLVVMGVLLLALFITGCSVNPAPAATVGPAGPPGAAGATGQTGDPGRDADQRRTEEQRRADDQKRADEQRRTDEQRGADQQRGADDQKRADEQKRADGKAQGHDEQCPAGEHRFTNRDTGKVSCVTD
jgi:hypothetical protein